VVVDPAKSSRKLIAQAARRRRWGPAATDEESRAGLQDRLNVYARTMFWSYIALLAFLWLAYRFVLGDDKPKLTSYVFGGSAIMLGVMAFLWRSVLARNNRLSFEWLYRLDLVFAIAIGLTFGTAAAMQYELQAASYTSLIFTSFTVFTRALLVPSSARRTTVTSIVTFAPVIAGGVYTAVFTRIEVPFAMFVGGGVTFAAIATLIAANGSGIIYGLRAEVREAMQLGSYKLGDKIGSGGIGDVYLAQHALLRRPTAIKLLKPERVGQENLVRFEREVQQTSRLTHPNTVTIFDYGPSAEGHFYYAMEYLDGINLDQLVKKHGRQPAGRVVHILKQVCGALQEAHGHGLIHRDIKPANIILCQRGGLPDVAKVVDFGLVKEIARDDGDSTHAQTILGTPAYLAPEMVDPSAPTTPAVDLYALGCVGYELLTGRRLFEAKGSIELMIAHATKTPQRPMDVADILIPNELEALIMQCLEKSPAARPASAAILLEMLEALPRMLDWTPSDAETFWREFRATQVATPRSDTPTETITVDVGRDKRGTPT